MSECPKCGGTHETPTLLNKTEWDCLRNQLATLKAEIKEAVDERTHWVRKCMEKDAEINDLAECSAENYALASKLEVAKAENERLRNHLDLVDPGGRVVAAPAQNPESK